jgi:hypothetical protein
MTILGGCVVVLSTQYNPIKSTVVVCDSKLMNLFVFAVIYIVGFYVLV